MRVSHRASWFSSCHARPAAELGPPSHRHARPCAGHSRFALVGTHKHVDGRDIGVRKHAVLWTAMPGHDAEGVACASVQPPVFHVQFSNSHARHHPYCLARPRVGPSSLCLPLKDEGGWRARRRNHCSLCARIPSRKYGAPLGAPPRQACAVRAYLRRLPSCAGPRFSWPPQTRTASVSQAPGGRLLLAARRSPGAARVRALRGTPAGAASCSTIRRL